MIVQFAKNSYQARALPISAQRCVNLYAEANPPDAKDPIALYNTPGIVPFASGLAGPVRGLQVMTDVLYAVAGNTFYSIASDGAATSIGTITSSTGLVSMDISDVPELELVDGANGWTYSTTAGLVPITDPDFKPTNTVTYQDGYFAFPRTGTSEWFISDLRNGQAFSATDFANAEGQADILITVKSNHREMWLFGSETIEVWFNSGDPDFPFDRIAGADIERGCAAAFSVVDEDNTLFWLGDDRTVYRAEGYTPRRISTHALEEEWRKYPTVSDAEAFSYTMSGHKFYVLTFPSGGGTFVYDMSTGLWHERETKGLARWSACCFAEAYGKQIVGHSGEAKIGVLDLDTYSEYGEPIQALATGPMVHRDRKRIFHQKFELYLESGVGVSNGQGSDPLVWLDWSDDGGRTFSSRKPPRSIGKIGEYRTRLRWMQMGQSRERCYRVTMSDPVKRSILEANLDVGLGVG